jgi:2,4-dienoyl-CoA reductase-like NADH-dependent reductase (Old Yellow Enzyme family)
MHLLRRVELYLRRSGTPATRFGREAMHDPRFVFDLRNGRELRSATSARVIAYLDTIEAGEDRPCSR